LKLGCRNPLKSGLLSYHTECAISIRDADLRRNPLKSGLLSYPLVLVPGRGTVHLVAIPSNRGCCPTLSGRWIDESQSPQIGAAVLPVLAKLRLPCPPCCRNPLKSGLLSYRPVEVWGERTGRESQSPQIGAAVLPHTFRAEEDAR